MIPRPEFPRPQFERDNWFNLNGEWQFDFDFGSSNKGAYDRADCTLPRAINVPFCPESELSGIGYLDFMPTVWYKRKFELTADKLDGRVLMHFGAVDYHATLWINGKKVGTHDGGYSSFEFDITDYVTVGENDVTVRADDGLRSGKQPRGKQSPHAGSFGCEYTRTTGIWQTVWLEFVPKCYIKRVKIDTDYASGSVVFDYLTAGEMPDGNIVCDISYNGEKVLTLSAKAGRNGILTAVIENPKLWNVGAPELYDVTFTLGEDKVKSYFGIRSIELNERTMLINGKPVFQRLVLDQGFYPDGICTAPSDEALKRDIELSIAVGFNGARLHQKVFEERFLYWADKLGYIVWGEQASWGFAHYVPDAAYNFIPEWLEVVERDYNHPSIIGWCPFNETWDMDGHRQDNRLLALTYHATKAMDKTRPVIDSSGNYHVLTDIYDIHEYDQNMDVIHERYDSTKVGKDGQLFDYHGQNGRQHYNGAPIFVSEYGGTWWNASKKENPGWGYGAAPKAEEEAVDRICNLTKYFLENENFCAVCYTQLYDIEQEQNGIYDYDRNPKFSKKSMERIKAAFDTVAGVEK